MANFALAGVKVIEFATMVSGPYCGKLLADLGADVIKVEPIGGDPARFKGPFPKTGPHHERSSLFLYINTSKRGVTLDLKKPEDLQTFRGLLKWADVLIDNHAPEVLEDLGLGWEALHRLHPGLIYTSITPYGRTGPRAKTKGDELTLIHAGGLSNLLPARSVDIDHPPVKMGGNPVGYHGGIFAAVSTMALLCGREKTGGEGHLIDISLQEVILNLIAPIVTGNRYQNTTWGRVPDRPPAMGRMETSDGYVILNATDDHHFRALRKVMGTPSWAAGDEWDDMFYRTHHQMDIAPMMEEWMRNQKRDDIVRRARERGIPIGPIQTAKEVMNYAQYAARKYFIRVDHPEAGTYRYAGWPYKMSATPPCVSRPAPLLGQHNQEIGQEDLISVAQAKRKNPSIETEKKKKSGVSRLPLKGIRVLDFSWVWAGPYACMLLANLGAEVIKVESHKRTDLTRRNFPWPLPDPEPTTCPPNQSMAFNSLNRDKKSLTLDLSRPEALDLARRLVAISDVVLDNMRPGAMIKLGLGYEDLCRVRPDIIVVTSSSRGLEGPESQYLGYALVHHGIGGGAYITGYPDDHPSHGSPGDVDLMNATTSAFATLVALYHRFQTGEGQFIDYSQCEGVSSIIGEVLLGYEMTSEIPERQGNLHPQYAPHNVYQCWGVDRWLALEIHSDEEFVILARVIGQPALAKDPRFATMVLRKKNEVELDRIIGGWIRMKDRDWVVNEFCKAGLMAAPSREGRDLYADPHLKARSAFAKINHPELGELELVAPPWRISNLTTPTGYAPLLGEHNQYVLGKLLGLSKEEIGELRKKEVIL
jgi:crotonobetainyl-CoA:carnitine CoA-transferase CaiB-like acyl-CoA transferase